MEEASAANVVSEDNYEAPCRWCCFSLCFAQRLIAELVGSYLLVFGGSTAIVVNSNTNGAVTLPGIAMVWGLLLMVLIYSLQHISGAHFNPAVTLALASCNFFPLIHVPAYISVQILGSILASATVRLVFEWKQNHFAGTVPSGSELQALVLEFAITFLFLFVISSVTTADHRDRDRDRDRDTNKSLGGVAIGATLSINVLIAGAVSGASVNPARSLGAAMVSGEYKGLWVYIVGPTSGGIAGACLYRFMGFHHSPINRTASILRRSSSIHIRSN